MKKPMEVSVVPAKEQADRSVYEALAMLIVEFYNQKTGFFICPWCEMKNRKKEKECEANGETCRSERPCESGNAVHNG